MSTSNPLELKLHHLSSPGSDSQRLDALSILRSHLPVSLPLYRRLQFGRFFSTSLLFTNLNLLKPTTEPRGESNGTTDDQTQQHPTPWLFAFVDRTCRPETEVWLFGSWEVAPAPPSATEAWHEIDQLVSNLVRACRDLPVPRSLHQDILEAQAAADSTRSSESSGVEGMKARDGSVRFQTESVMLWGAIHEATMPVLRRLDVLSDNYQEQAPNHTFVFDVDALPPAPALPDGMMWGVIEQEYFGLVRSKSAIPRWERTMASLPSLAIYQDDATKATSAPIAWAFVGLDASLTTLHVEPE
ncbi:hypothetical protein B0A50_07215 [Salinomyces thailandicus]|uniref:Uncharacterized protein n=1 Tax=Salinomyces thailandicus TaxID=706561 RepID=A0A4U0TM97_9PEZI|nr:hypothetical protein B0A50_07215 [Salinomyces thailandica]